MAVQIGTTNDTVVRRTNADWDSYLQEKLIELGKLVEKSGKKPSIITK